MIESRKMDITAEHKQEETSSAIGMAGTVAAIGNFERADAFAIIVANGLAEAQIKLGSDPTYAGSNALQYIFKPDTVNNKPGASKLLAIQPGERKKATLTLKFKDQEMVLEAVSGGKWGNNIKISSTEGTNRDYQFIYDIGGVKKGYDNKTPAEIMDKINSSNSYLTAKLVDKQSSTFEETLNEPLTGGEESDSLTINDYIEALEFIIKEDVDILIFTDILDDSFKPIVSEYLEDKKTKNNRSISLASITPNDTIDDKINIVDTARSSDAYYLNQNIQVNDTELGESESVARTAGIIAGTPVTQSLSKQTIGDIQKVDPILTDKEIDDLTDKGIMCFELINRENNEYGIYSAVSSCIDTNENGKKVPESEFHAVRAEIYVEKYFDKKIREVQGKTGKALSLLSLNSLLSQAVAELITNNIVISLTAEASEDPEDSEKFLINYNGVLNGIVNRIHNVYTWTME
jgi:tail sheath protein